jgi:hypothetical protein
LELQPSYSHVSNCLEQAGRAWECGLFEVATAEKELTMPTITRYTPIKDSDEQDPLVLPIDAAETYEFDLDGLEEARSREDAVLAWVVDTEVGGQQLEVTLNNHQVTLTAKLPGDAYQTLHEIVPGKILRPKTDPEKNKLTFTVKGSNGVMRISDVVLWWQYDM